MSGITDYRANYAAATTAFHAGFEALYGRVKESIYRMFTEEVPVKGLTLEAPFLSDGSAVRKWLGEKQFKDLRSFRPTYAVEAYERSLRLPALEMRHDSSGAIGRKVSNWLASTPGYFEKPVFDMLLSNPTGFDGVALGHASHPYGSGGATQSNITTDALGHASYRAGLKAMRGWLMENAEPLEMNGTALVCGTTNEDIALEVAGIDKPVNVTTAGALDGAANVVGITGIANVFKGRTTVITTPRITGAQWFIMDLSKPGIRPIVLGLARPVTPSVVDDPESYPRFYEDDWDASLEADFAVGAGLWPSIYGRWQS